MSRQGSGPPDGPDGLADMASEEVVETEGEGTGEATEAVQVPLADPSLGDRETRQVREVLESGDLAAGEEVRAFENEFADFCGAGHGVATANGTAALHAALEALGVGEGDVVVTTPLTFVATANAVRFAGAEPVFADVDPETYTLDPAAVETAVREHAEDAAAILAVHLYGLPADMDPLREVADAHDLALVEDAAQAHGARYRGNRVGSLGDAACFSFYPTKNMTTGEGGMVLTDREDVARQAARFVNHGRNGDGTHVEVGHNFRMTNVAAAIGRVQLDRLPGYTEQRREHARRLNRAVADSPLVAPTEPEDRMHVYHQYTVRCQAREATASALETLGVDTGVYYPTPVNREPAYADVDPSTPVADRLAGEVLSLPVGPHLTEEDLDRVTIALAYLEEYLDDGT